MFCFIVFFVFFCFFLVFLSLVFVTVTRKTKKNKIKIDFLASVFADSPCYFWFAGYVFGFRLKLSLFLLEKRRVPQAILGFWFVFVGFA